MALSETLKASLKINAEYYKANKDKPIRPETGFPSTLDQIETELQQPNISEEDKKLLLDWMDAFSQIKIENDTTAEARRVKIKGDMQKLRSNVAAPATSVATTPLVPNTTPTTPANGIKEVKEALSVINPKNLEEAIATSEKFINMLPAGETQTTLRGIHGAVIFDILRSAGHNLVMQNGQITIVPKPGSDVVNLQEKFQTLVNTSRISLDTIKIGMLYSSPSFAKYAEMKKTKDASGKEIIDPKASPQNFIAYIADIQKAGNKSGDITAILGSQAMFQGVNMQQAIKGFQDMGQVNAEWAKQDPQKVADAIRGTPATASPSNAPAPRSPGSPDVPPSPPPQPGTIPYYANIAGTEAGKFGADAGKNAGGILGGIGNTLSGFVKGVGEGAGPLGAGVAVIGLIYAGYKLLTGQVKGHSGFFWSVMALLGGSGLMAGLKRFGIDIPDMTAGEAADKAKKAAEEAAEKAKKLAGGAGSTDEKKDGEKKGDERSAEATGLTESQKGLRKMTTENTELTERITKFASAQEKAKQSATANLDYYISFIEKDLKDVSLSKLFPTDHKSSIFFDESNSELPTDSKISPKMLKLVLRTYLTGKDTLTGNGDKIGETEKDVFLRQHNLTPADIANKKLSEILESVHKLRTGSVVVAPAGAQAAPVSQQSTPASTVTATPTKHKIGTVDIDVGKSVEVTDLNIIYDSNGQALTTTKSSKLLKQADGRYAIAIGASPKLLAGKKTIGGAEFVEVEYDGEKFYTALQYLKP